MIDTVVFDLGGVLVDFHPIEGIRSLGFSEEAVEVFREKIFASVWEECDRYPYTDEEIRARFKAEVPGFEKEVDLLCDHFPALTGEYEYSRDWILSLKKAGKKVYILSNYGRRSFEENSKTYSFMGDVDGKVISYELQMVKPEPGIYQELAAKYGFSPENAVFIDDRQVNIDGAIAQGYQGIWFESYETARRKLEEILNR